MSVTEVCGQWIFTVNKKPKMKTSFSFLNVNLIALKTCKFVSSLFFCGRINFNLEWASVPSKHRTVYDRNKTATQRRLFQNATCNANFQFNSIQEQVLI